MQPIVKVILLGGALYGGSRLLKRTSTTKKGSGAKPLANFQAINNPQTLSFAVADRQYKYEEGLSVRPAVLLIGPTQEYVRGKAIANPGIDFIWTTKEVLKGTQGPTPPSPMDKLPSTTVWAFPVGGILAGQWVKDSGTGDVNMNAEMIATAISLATTGETGPIPDQGMTEYPGPVPHQGSGEYPLPPVPTPDA